MFVHKRSASKVLDEHGQDLRVAMIAVTHYTNGNTSTIRRRPSNAMSKPESSMINSRNSVIARGNAIDRSTTSNLP